MYSGFLRFPSPERYDAAGGREEILELVLEKKKLEPSTFLQGFFFVLVELNYKKEGRKRGKRKEKEKKKRGKRREKRREKTREKIRIVITHFS